MDVEGKVEKKEDVQKEEQSHSSGVDVTEMADSKVTITSDSGVPDKAVGMAEPFKKPNCMAESFKTPSFVIPSKKKVQSNTSASGMFKSPDSAPNTSSKKVAASHDEKNVDSDIKKEVEENVKDKTDVIKINGKSESAKSSQSTVKSSAVGSPAEQLKRAQTAIPYKEPAWSLLCEEKYNFEVIKNGAIVGQTDLSTKAFHVVGRLPSCDVPMEHPSLSRHHAVIQYSGGDVEAYPQGWYLYDLDSTHGTWINKNKVPPHKYHRLHVDYVVKFGGSTRLFILQGPDSDRMEESELSVDEMRDQREKQKKEAELLRLQELEEAERQAEVVRKREENKGCSWGFDDDVEEEETEEETMASFTTENENLYIDDPKKSLNGYFEREGLDLPEYDFEDAGFGKRKCSIELPLDTPTGEPMKAEVIVSGKKKEAVIACALEACRILDRHGLLRKSTHESRKKKQRNWADDDFYDSDEDVYLDRTGTIEKKRVIRMAKTGKGEKAADTYDSLLEKHKNIVAEIEEIEAKVEQAKAQAAAMESDDVDALDAYMSAIKSGMMDTKTKMKMKRQLLELKQEEQKVRKLVNIAKPASLPDLVPSAGKTATQKSSLTSSVGRMKGSSQMKVVRKTVQMPKQTVSEDKDFEVEEDEEDDNRGNSTDAQTEKSRKDGTVRPESANIVLESVNMKKDQIEQKKQKVPAVSATSTTSKPKGPLPLAAVLERLQNDEDAMETENTDGADVAKLTDSSKRKSKSNIPAREKKKKLQAAATDFDASDPEYAGWIPPQNQAGDGKTFLNEKFGY